MHAKWRTIRDYLTHSLTLNFAPRLDNSYAEYTKNKLQQMSQ